MNFISKFDITSQFTSGKQVIILALLIWSLAWKGLALWKAAHRESRNWFIALLAVNTLGILDILYLYVFSKNRKSDTNIQMNANDTNDTN